MTEATFNDILQWVCVAVIILIVIIAIIRKVRRFNRHMKNGGSADCSCGCDGCSATNCPLPKKRTKK